MDFNSINISQDNPNDLLLETKKKFGEIESNIQDFRRYFNKYLNQIVSEKDQLLRNQNLLQATINELKTKNGSLSEQFTQINTQNGQLQQKISATQQEYANLQITNNENTIKYNKLAISYKTIHEENERNKKMLQEAEKIIYADPIEDFNNWAADPSKYLPNRFYYLGEEIKVRMEQNFSASDVPTEWISNKRTEQRYLLPNPNFFDELTNIKNFYKMDIGQLKPRGQNKIQIIEPCKISDNGWISNPGELEFK
ncbi:MAG: hypothetical protein LBU51_03490 [Bacteroidales bacterium]|jgi:FtsZ-binding cell division protein ZapB|nr:hypothetical protein [Bacteroidales bacterium]